MGFLYFRQTTGSPGKINPGTQPAEFRQSKVPNRSAQSHIHPDASSTCLCLDSEMGDTEPDRIVSATRVISASAERIFELIADPSRQPSWDGNNNLASAAPGQRVRQVGDIFKTTLTSGAVRENHVVEFIEGSKIAWCPAEPKRQPPGHLWRWELHPINATLTSVTHTYDWTALTDGTRLPRAEATTADMLRESIDRLAMLAQAPDR